MPNGWYSMSVLTRTEKVHQHPNPWVSPRDFLRLLLGHRPSGIPSIWTCSEASDSPASLHTLEAVNAWSDLWSLSVTPLSDLRLTKACCMSLFFQVLQAVVSLLSSQRQTYSRNQWMHGRPAVTRTGVRPSLCQRLWGWCTSLYSLHWSLYPSTMWLWRLVNGTGEW